ATVDSIREHSGRQTDNEPWQAHRDRHQAELEAVTGDRRGEPGGGAGAHSVAEVRRDRGGPQLPVAAAQSVLHGSGRVIEHERGETSWASPLPVDSPCPSCPDG